jgi:ABC-type branched-subunit amino acid transport system ATPase component
MATEPRFLALDEPTTGLAPTIVQELAHKISESRQTGAGILWVVEENPMDILPHCDRVYVMQGGRIAHHAPAREMLASDSLRALFLGLDHGTAPAGS